MKIKARNTSVKETFIGYTVKHGSVRYLFYAAYSHLFLDVCVVLPLSKLLT